MWVLPLSEIPYCIFYTFYKSIAEIPTLLHYLTLVGLGTKVLIVSIDSPPGLLVCADDRHFDTAEDKFRGGQVNFERIQEPAAAPGPADSRGLIITPEHAQRRLVAQ